MFIPLVDILRCVKPHEDTWLVASIDRAEDRDIRSGTLGCPVCHAEYAIRDGVVYFENVDRSVGAVAPSEHDAMRLAAALDLTDARTTAVLHGTWAAHAQLIRSMSPAQLVLVNPPLDIVSGDGISVVVAGHAPIAHGSVNAVAIDAHANEAMRSSLRAALKSGGRMLAPLSVSLSSGLSELVRDDDIWVAELLAGESVSAPIMPSRRPR